METIEQIKIDEGGYKPEVYLCSSGKLTWLYGRNIEDRPITPKEWLSLSNLIKSGKKQSDWANILFLDELNMLHESLKNGYNFNIVEYPVCVQRIILNMSYNMGVTRFNPIKWPKFFGALVEKNWKQAAIEGRDSRWFTQVGIRSKRLMNSLESIDIAV